MILQKLHHSQRILHMTFHTQRECFQTLQKNKGIERTDSSSGIAQQNGTDTDSICSRTCRIGKAHAMIARIGFGQLRKFTGSYPIELAAIYNNTA